MNGLKLAALCGFYPHRLGLCGPKNSSAKKNLSDFLSGKKVSAKKIRKILTAFKGAFSYYKLIAKSNGIEDPFDERAVKAYWFGNRLLENVSIGSLKEMLLRDFSKPIKKIPSALKPHHSFHVLAAGSLSGRMPFKVKPLDLCLIRWGKIISYKINKTEKEESAAIVEYRPLQKTHNKYLLGKAVRKAVFWDRNFIPKIRAGNWVALHWEHIVQNLTKKDLALLKKYTKITTDSLNIPLLAQKINLFLKELDGKRLGNYRLYLGKVKDLPLSGWKRFELYLKDKKGYLSNSPMIEGIFSVGGKEIKPWLDLDYHPFVSSKSLEKKLFDYLGQLIPRGGHIMVSYEGKDKIHLETWKALALGIPPSATPLGFLLFQAGFQLIKDWYLAEGGLEGPRKLWGEKAPNQTFTEKFYKKTKRQILNFLKRKPNPAHKELEDGSRERSKEILKIIRKK
jgi:hypothetical protein